MKGIKIEIEEQDKPMYLYRSFDVVSAIAYALYYTTNPNSDMCIPNCAYKKAEKMFEEWSNETREKKASFPPTAKPNISIDPIQIKLNHLYKKITDYVESQIKEFLEENKISEKNWNKRGIIQEMPPEIGCKSYILYYKTWRKELKRKVTVEYNFIS